MFTERLERHGGASRSDHLAQARRMGKDVPEDRLPPLPAAAAHLLGWFSELNPCRDNGAMGGAGAITHCEILAWCTLTGRRPDLFELSCIRALDTAYRLVSSREAARGRNKQTRT